MSLTGWFTRRAPKPVIGSPIMQTPASYLFSPLPDTVLPPPQLISLKAGQGPSDSPLTYDLSNKAPGIASRTFNALETFKKHHRSHSAQPTASSSRSPANGHDTHGPLRSHTAPVPQTPAIGSNTPSQSVYRSHTTPVVGSSQALYPEQTLRSGPGTQDSRTYSTDTIRGPSSVQANGSDPSQPPTSYSKDSYSGRNRSKDSVVAGHTGSVSGTIKSKRKPVPLHNIFPDGTVEYATPISASAPIQLHGHDTPMPGSQRLKRESAVQIPAPPPQPQSAPVHGSFPTSTPVMTTTTGVLGVEQQPTTATPGGSYPGSSAGDVYPAGYATVVRSGKDREKDKRDKKGKKDKKKKDKGSPPADGEYAVLTAKDSALLATPLITTISASSQVPGSSRQAVSVLQSHRPTCHQTHRGSTRAWTRFHRHSRFLEWALLLPSTTRCRFRPPGTNLSHTSLPATPVRSPRPNVLPPNLPRQDLT
jgi:hypothetical protein